MKSLQAIYRATVMIGTLIVGGLAYRAYGPQLEKLAPVFERAKQVAMEFWESRNAQETPLIEMPPAGPPAEFTASAMPMESLAAAPPLIDSHVEPSANWSLELDNPAEQSAEQSSGASPVAMVVSQLNQCGVSEYSLTRWGGEGNFYRFHCSAPWGEGAGFARHFEAVAEDPAAAAQQVLQQVQQWQTSRN